MKRNIKDYTYEVYGKWHKVEGTYIIDKVFLMNGLNQNQLNS